MSGSVITNSMANALASFDGTKNTGTITAGGTSITTFNKGSNSGFLEAGAAGTGAGLALTGTVNNAGGMIQGGGAGVTVSGTLQNGTITGAISGDGSTFNGVNFLNADISGSIHLSSTKGTITTNGDDTITSTNAGAASIEVQSGRLTDFGNFTLSSGKSTTIDPLSVLQVFGRFTGSDDGGSLVFNLASPDTSGLLELSGALNVTGGNLIINWGGYTGTSPFILIDAEGGIRHAHFDSYLMNNVPTGWQLAVVGNDLELVSSGSSVPEPRLTVILASGLLTLGLLRHWRNRG
jgi:hypothetical protein